YLSLGTLHRGSEAFLRDCLKAFAGLPARFVLSTGSQVDPAALGMPVPSNCLVLPSAPQLAVLRRAAVFITHGGMNSVLEGLTYGVPLLVIPTQVEQVVIGLTVAERGAALVRREHLAGRRLDAGTLRHDVERMLTTPAFKLAASELQAQLGATSGYRQAADEVQAYVAAGT